MTLTTSAPAPPSNPLRRKPLRQALSSPAGFVGFVIAVSMVLLGILAPLIAPSSPEATAFDRIFLPPGEGGLFGTDDLGRDQLSRVLYGINASVTIGLLSVLLSAAIGVPMGLLAGYFRAADAVISRIIEVMMAFPALIVALGLAAILGPSATNVTIALAISNVPGFARIIRGEMFRLRGQDYITASVALGASHTRVIGTHLLPNAMSALLVQVTVTIPNAVLGEAMLSFLGLGIRPPAPSLGTMLSNAQPYLQSAWWMAVIPGLAIMAITLAFNLFGDALRDALDPKSQRR
ncbi:ABC transporter permease [Nesterenkonia ebinurensis]|uniref:ABC transporter permease n=1 Tax=Nesterenkonia ebinurensis TaxID=2608252 RepID=UPI00123D604F|nr:ABC transporter permease [Nesterenkonia ebinurensis]